MSKDYDGTPEDIRHMGRAQLEALAVNLQRSHDEQCGIIDAMAKELSQAYANLTNTQTRCTELIQELRDLKRHVAARSAAEKALEAIGDEYAVAEPIPR